MDADLGRADPQKPYPAQRRDVPGRPAPPFRSSQNPIEARIFQNGHTLLSLKASWKLSRLGPAGRWSFGVAPTVLSEVSLPFLLFAGSGSPGDPVQNRYPLPHPGGYPVNWNAGRRLGMVVLASQQATLLVTPKGPGLRPGSLLGATKAEILLMPLRDCSLHAQLTLKVILTENSFRMGPKVQGLFVENPKGTQSRCPLPSWGSNPQKPR